MSMNSSVAVVDVEERVETAKMSPQFSRECAEEIARGRLNGYMDMLEVKTARNPGDFILKGIGKYKVPVSLFLDAMLDGEINVTSTMRQNPNNRRFNFLFDKKRAKEIEDTLCVTMLGDFFFCHEGSYARCIDGNHRVQALLEAYKKGDLSESELNCLVSIIIVSKDVEHDVKIIKDRSMGPKSSDYCRNEGYVLGSYVSQLIRRCSTEFNLSEEEIERLLGSHFSQQLSRICFYCMKYNPQDISYSELHRVRHVSDKAQRIPTSPENRILPESILSMIIPAMQQYYLFLHNLEKVSGKKGCAYKRIVRSGPFMGIFVCEKIGNGIPVGKDCSRLKNCSLSKIAERVNSDIAGLSQVICQVSHGTLDHVTNCTERILTLLVTGVLPKSV